MVLKIKFMEFSINCFLASKWPLTEMQINILSTPYCFVLFFKDEVGQYHLKMIKLNDTVRRRAENKVICCLESLATGHPPPSITLTIILTTIFLMLLLIALITCVRRRKEADQVRYVLCYGGFAMAVK